MATVNLNRSSSKYQARIVTAYRAILILVHIGCVGYAVYVAVTDSFPKALLVFVGVCALATATLPLILRKGLDLFEPINFVILAVLIGVTLKCVYVVGSDNTWVTSYVLVNHDPEFLLKAGAIIVYALTFLSIGYALRIPGLRLNWLPLFKHDGWKFSRIVIIGVFSIVLAGASFFMFVSSMSIKIETLGDISSKHFYFVEGATSHQYSALGYYRWGTVLIEIFYYIYLTWFLSSHQRKLSIAGVGAIVLGLMAIIFPILNSSRSGVVVVLLVSMIIFYYLKGDFKLKQAGSLAVIIVLFLMVMTGLRQGAENVDEIGEFVRISPIIDNTIGSRHFLDIAKTAHIIDSVHKNLELEYGKTFLTWIVSPIPRVLWPSKPTLGSGPLIGSSVFNLQRAGVPPGIIAELYMNFGILGIGPGMFMVGILLRIIYMTFRPVLSQKNGIIFYAVLIIPWSYGLLSNDFSKAIVQTFKYGLPLLILLSFVSPSKDNPRPKRRNKHISNEIT